jgi:hypothetical protein
MSSKYMTIILNTHNQYNSQTHSLNCLDPTTDKLRNAVRDSIKNASKEFTPTNEQQSNVSSLNEKLKQRINQLNQKKQQDPTIQSNPCYIPHNSSKISSKDKTFYEPDDALVFSCVKDFGSRQIAGYMVRCSGNQVEGHQIFTYGTPIENEVECNMLAFSELDKMPQWNKQTAVHLFPCIKIDGSQVQNCNFNDLEHPFTKRLLARNYLQKRMSVALASGVGLEKEKAALRRYVDGVAKSMK